MPWLTAGDEFDAARVVIFSGHQNPEALVWGYIAEKLGHARQRSRTRGDEPKRRPKRPHTLSGCDDRAHPADASAAGVELARIIAPRRRWSRVSVEVSDARSGR